MVDLISLVHLDEGKKASFVMSCRALGNDVSQPVFHASELPLEEVRRVRTIGEQRCPLQPGYEINSQVNCLFTFPKQTKLLLDPLQLAAKDLCSFLGQLIIALAHLLTETAARTPIDRDLFSTCPPSSYKGKKSMDRIRVLLPSGKVLLVFTKACLNDGFDQQFFCPKMAVDIAKGNLCFLGDISQRAYGQSAPTRARSPPVAPGWSRRGWR
jgi:hypothetical protein